MILHKVISSMMDQVQKFRIFGLACNHTKDSPSVDRSAIWFGFYDHVFQKIFGEKWWCPCHVHPHNCLSRVKLGINF